MQTQGSLSLNWLPACRYSVADYVLVRCFAYCVCGCSLVITPTTSDNHKGREREKRAREQGVREEARWNGRVRENEMQAITSKWRGRYGEKGRPWGQMTGKDSGDKKLRGRGLKQAIKYK